MSVQKVQRVSGVRWRVYWRDEQGRQKSRNFTKKRDADTYDAHVKLVKRRGELAQLDAGKQTLREFAAEWWRLYAEPSLAPKTLKLYSSLRDRHILPKLGHLQLRSVTPQRVQRFQVELREAGVGQETIRKTLAMLQGMLERAVEWDRLQRNPVRSVKKPPQVRARTILPLAPGQVERLRNEMLRSGWTRDAALVAVLAYSGVRPGEALALRWRDVRERTMIVDKATSMGQEGPTKTGARRTVSLLQPLRSDLDNWRAASGNPGDEALVFPTAAGTLWSDADFRNWRRRRFKVAAASAGLGDTLPYDLRHSYASLLLAEGRNVAEIAAQMGHTLQTLLGTYAHVIDDLRGRPLIDPSNEILSARSAADVAPLLPEPEKHEQQVAASAVEVA